MLEGKEEGESRGESEGSREKKEPLSTNKSIEGCCRQAFSAIRLNRESISFKIHPFVRSFPALRECPARRSCVACKGCARFAMLPSRRSRRFPKCGPLEFRWMAEFARMRIELAGSSSGLLRCSSPPRISPAERRCTGGSPRHCSLPEEREGEKEISSEAELVWFQLHIALESR